MKLLLWPAPDTIAENHGIGRIIHAQYKYLPQHGIEFVFEPRQADVIAAHTQQEELPWIDVLHLHGMYWTAEPKSGQYVGYHHMANQRIVEAARRAHLISVPSVWTTLPFRRDMRLSPRVIGHGIDFAEWSRVPEHKGYVLWNKNRNRDVCDPTPALELALRGIPVVSTFGVDGRPAPDAMKIVGTVEHDKMKLLVSYAEVYLATVKETYGIGTLEALACGVPVLGYNHGGTADIVQHKVTGYLAKPGDIDDLQAGYEYCKAHRAELSENAREYASHRDWQFVIPEYVQLYDDALRAKQEENTGVSIIITNHNYAKYLPEAVMSAAQQTIGCEIVVVDDGSTDNSLEVIGNLAKEFPIRVVAQANQGVAAARNNGIAESRGGLIICLDADDRLDSRYAEAVRNAMVADRGLGIGYTALALIGKDGKTTENNGWPIPFTSENQFAPGNPPNTCFHCASMFRRSMWERAGGYRQQFAPGEDTEFFTRGLSVGFTAKLVIPEPLFEYRTHEGSASRTKQYIPIDAYMPWMHDKLYPMGVPLDRGVPPIRSYSEPKVSVIIPVGPNHGELLAGALESLVGQTMRDWEAIVVLDQAVLPEATRTTYPFATYLRGTTGKGSSYARNVGLQAAKAPLVVFLDADDRLFPDALLEMCREYTKAGGRYIYTDWVALYKGKAQVEVVPEYEPMALLHAGQHAITALMATADAQYIGFDEALTYLEDWDFFARCAIAGIHGRHLAQPLVGITIRDDRKTAQLAANEKLLDASAHKVFDALETYREGKAQMGSCCGGNGDALLAAKEAIFGRTLPVTEEYAVGQIAPDVVRMEFVGPSMGGQFFGGPGATPSGTRYKGGRNSHDRFLDVDPRDVAWLKGSGQFQTVQQPAPNVQVASGENVLETLARANAEDSRKATPLPVSVVDAPTEKVFASLGLDPQPEVSLEEPPADDPMFVSSSKRAAKQAARASRSAAPVSPKNEVKHDVGAAPGKSRGPVVRDPDDLQD